MGKKKRNKEQDPVVRVYEFGELEDAYDDLNTARMEAIRNTNLPYALAGLGR